MNFINDWTRSFSPVFISSMPTTLESYVASSPICRARARSRPLWITLQLVIINTMHSINLSTFHSNCTFSQTPYISHDYVAPQRTTMATSYEHLGKSEMGQHHRLGVDFSTLVASAAVYHLNTSGYHFF
jgi:hypothetical protein